MLSTKTDVISSLSVNIRDFTIISSSLQNDKLSVLLAVYLGTSRGIMVSKLDKQTTVNEFDSHWVPWPSATVELSLINYYSQKVSSKRIASFKHMFFWDGLILTC